MKIYIYAIWFPTSEKYYVGQTQNLQGRMQGHLRSGSLVCKALYKYDDWQISILHTVKTKEEANRIEIEEIRNFNSVAPNGYNLTRGGDGWSKGMKHSEETKKKMKQAAIGKKCPWNIERNKKNKGKKRPEINGVKNPAFERMSSNKNPMKDPEIVKRNANARIGKKCPWVTKRNEEANPAKRPEIAVKIGDGNRGKKCPYLSESNRENNPMKRLDVRIARKKRNITRLEKEIEDIE